jgi:nucleoside-diphosphate kinase
LERTLVLVKPDAMQRKLVGEIVSRLERKGVKLVGLKMMQLDQQILRDHYAHLVDKPFFAGIAAFMSSTPVVAACFEGVDVVATVRRACGVTKAREADPGTIRGDLALSIQANLVHASDSVETAEVEVKRFFKPNELFDYDELLAPVIYAPGEG